MFVKISITRRIPSVGEETYDFDWEGEKIENMFDLVRNFDKQWKKALENSGQ